MLKEPTPDKQCVPRSSLMSSCPLGWASSAQRRWWMQAAGRRLTARHTSTSRCADTPAHRPARVRESARVLWAAGIGRRCQMDRLTAVHITKCAIIEESLQRQGSSCFSPSPGPRAAATCQVLCLPKPAGGQPTGGGQCCRAGGELGKFFDTVQAAVSSACLLRWRPLVHQDFALYSLPQQAV